MGLNSQVGALVFSGVVRGKVRREMNDRCP